MEPKAMGFEMKVKTICRPLLFIFDSTSLQYFGIRWNAMGKVRIELNSPGIRALLRSQIGRAHV